MQLLVSVSNALEAEAALRGGADLIDAKNPRAGALGQVSHEAFAEICTAVSLRRPVSAALGEAYDPGQIERLASAFAAEGAAFLKVGFLGIADLRQVRRLAEAAVLGARRGLGRTAIVAVAYADAHRVGALAPPDLTRAAAEAGVDGLLIDTADKEGPGLSELASRSVLDGWVASAHEAGLFVALAGKLTAGDLDLVREAGADIAGVRGAACDGGRLGRISPVRIRSLRKRLASGARALPVPL
jgi:hypothetical protein